MGPRSWSFNAPHHRGMRRQSAHEKQLKGIDSLAYSLTVERTNVAVDVPSKAGFLVHNSRCVTDWTRNGMHLSRTCSSSSDSSI